MRFMPIYEYQCEACGHRLERLQKVSDPLLSDCPACEKPALGKLVSAAVFRLKGGGWYETDFKTGGKRNVAGGDGDAPPDGKDGKDGKGGKDGKDGKQDKKPEAASDGKPSDAKPDKKPEAASDSKQADKKPSSKAASASHA